MVLAGEGVLKTSTKIATWEREVSELAGKESLRIVLRE
jgi:hypothetical protein